MIKINQEIFKRCKNSDTLIIYGCGYSINNLVSDQRKELGKFDSLGFNWFCKSKIPTTFYLIREQCVPEFRVREAETLVDLYRDINSETYKNTIMIVHKGDHLKQKGGYSHFDNLNLVNGKGIIISDIRTKASRVRQDPSIVVKKFTNNIFSVGIQHGLTTLYNAMHLATYLGYKKIVFVGVDLYDSRYFWLDPQKSRGSLKKKKRNYKSKHATAELTLNLIRTYKNTYPNVQLFTYDEKSLLSQEMGVWGGQ